MFACTVYDLVLLCINYLIVTPLLLSLNVAILFAVLLH